MSGLIVCLFFSLASLQQIAANHRTSLQHETQQTLEILKDLPSECTQDLDSMILTKQSELSGEVFYCSVSSIVIDIAEVFVDTGFFGFEAYVAVPALLTDLQELRKCLNETTPEAMVACAVLYLPGTVQAVEVIAGCLENYVGEMQMILPLLVQEIQQCMETSEKQYKAMLQSVLDKATTCAR